MNDPVKVSESALLLYSTNAEQPRQARRGIEGLLLPINVLQLESRPEQEEQARKVDIPATIVNMKGRPKRRKGWLLRFLL